MDTTAGPPGSLPDISIRQLEYLVAVAEAPTWATAAETVGVSPSALSQGLAELERRVGVTLFEAHGRRRLLRASAAPVLAHARQVLGLTADLATWADRIRTASSGRVRLGMIDAAAVVHLPDALRRFTDERPDVDVHLTVAPSAALLEQLVAGRLDVVACVAPPAPVPGIALRPLLTEDLAVYAPTGRVRLPAAEWGPWVLFPHGSHTRNVVVDELRALGASIDVVAESHQPEVLIEMVRLGMGWTVLPTAQAERGDRPLTRGRRLASRELVLATRDGAVPDPALDALADALADHARTIPA